MNKRVVYGIVALLLAVAGGLLWLSRDAAPHPGGSSTAPAISQSASGIPRTVGAPINFVTSLEGLPASLRGTEAPSFVIDDQGHLVITRDLRAVFDYFLTTVGEESIETIIARIRAYIRYVLKGKPAAAEAENILDGYIGYKRALVSIPTLASTPGSQAQDIDAYRRQMEQVAALRRQYLSSEVIQAFFGDDDVYDRYTLNRLQIMENKSLTQANKDQEIAALEQQLPPAIQEHLKQARALKALQELQDACSQRNCSATELHDSRVAMVGADATARLEKLDQDNAAWDQRINSWLVQRAAILGNKTLSDSDRQKQISALRSSLFTQDELVQVKNLEQIHDEGGPTTTGGLLRHK